MRSVAVLADTDRRWRWGLTVARRLNPAAVVTGYQFAGSDIPSQRQLADAGIAADSVSVVSAGELLAALVASPVDVLIVALRGGGVQAVLHLLARATLEPRPLVLSGYTGVVQERQIEGLLLRAGADVITANSPSELELFRSAFTQLGLDTGALALTRLPFLRAGGPQPRSRFTVTFAGQSEVPGARWQRRYLVERLAEHARRHPERDVFLRLRNHPGDPSRPAEQYPYDELVRSLGADRPVNLKLAGGDLGRVLDRTDLLVTINSAVAVESIHRGLSTAVVTDFGIRESLGNTYFIGSGCLVSFDELDEGALPLADAGWARMHGLAEEPDPLPARVAQLLATGPLPPIEPFYNLSNGKALLPGLLANYGVGTDGRPLGFQITDNNPGLRKAVRRSARNMYRHGSEVVAPVLRRLASL